MCSDDGIQLERPSRLQSKIPKKYGISSLRTHEDKYQFVHQLLTQKEALGLSFDTIAKKLG